MARKIKNINADFEDIIKMATHLSLQSLFVNTPAAPLNAPSETNSFTLDPIFIGRDHEVLELVQKLTDFRQEAKLSILAIVGMGGMGKTTLTRKVFNDEKVKDRFGSHVWVHVSQTFEPIMLFKKILSIGDGAETEQIVLEKLKEAFKAKTYLLVLDDVWYEDLSKWEYFINSIFGVTSTNGNAIIITTRKYNVASLVSPLHTHCLKGLSDEECWSIIKAKAFKNEDVPSGGFEMIGKEIVKICQHLPLAANVVGGVLRGKSKEEWSLINEKWRLTPLRYLTLEEESPTLPKQVAKYLREFEGQMSGNMLKDMKYLHVLTLRGGYRVKELPNSIRKMIHLRNLNISDTSIEKLPDWIGALYHLQTLRADNACLVELPSALKYLINLRHLYVSQWVELPAEIGRLIYLQTLPHFRVGDEKGYTIEELGSLNNLKGELRISNLQKVHSKEEALKANIFQKPNLFELNFEWGYRFHSEGETNDESVLEGLQPHPNLKKLGIKGFKGRRFPLWSEKMAVRDGPQGSNWVPLNNLIEIRLSSCGECEEIPMLEHLPNLRELMIWDCPKLRELPDGLHTLKSLKELTIVNCQKMRSIGNPSGGVGHSQGILRKLSIRRCRGLMELPRQMVESWAPSLETLHLVELSNLENLPMLINCLAKSKHLKKLEIVCIRKWMIGELETVVKELECLPNRLFYDNKNLSKLSISGCPKLRVLPDGLHTLNSLKELRIVDCQNLRSIGNPSGGVGHSQGILRELSIIRCGGLIELPRQMVEWWAPSLETLYLEELSSLENLPMLIDCLAKSTHLNYLKIIGVPKLMAACTVESWDLASLKYLFIDISKEWSMESSVGIAKTVNDILQGCCNTLEWFSLKGNENWERLPESIQHLTSLSRLEIENSSVEELPQWFGNLSSLSYLSLKNCKKLRCPPLGNALEKLAKLQGLIIRDCPELILIDSE